MIFKKFLHKKHNGNFGDILGSLVVMVFMFVILTATININIITTKKSFVDRELRRAELILEQKGTLDETDRDTLIKDFKDQNFSSVNIEVLVGDNDKEVAGLTAVYGQEVSIKITATATGKELDMFPVIITGDQRDKDYTFGGKYTTLCKAGSNGT